MGTQIFITIYIPNSLIVRLNDGTKHLLDMLLERYLEHVYFTVSSQIFIHTKMGDYLVLIIKP